MSKTLGVSPLLVFVCMLFGGMLMGIFGIILAVPIAVIFSIVFPLSQGEKTKKEASKKTIKSRKETT
jgi:predicted PurR-regulated permease PerM